MMETTPAHPEYGVTGELAEAGRFLSVGSAAQALIYLERWPPCVARAQLEAADRVEIWTVRRGEPGVVVAFIRPNARPVYLAYNE